MKITHTIDLTRKCKKSKLNHRNNDSNKGNAEKVGSENSNGRKQLYTIFYIFVGLFVISIGYLTYYISVKSNSTINNTYNKRGEKLAQWIQRGDILTSDGVTIAKTEVATDKTEHRIYPYDNLFSHVVGRTSKGGAGIEASQNITLLTSHSNPFTKILNDLVGQKSLGDHVVTTLDFDLQKVAYDALGSRKGAIVVMEPSTGKILAMVSKPDYNPNTVITDWENLNTSENAPLLNRASQGMYPPGSTFKTITTLAYLRQYKMDQTYDYDCGGSFTLSDHTIRCYNSKVHGHEDLKTSYANSCNSSYANLATQIDPVSMISVCNDFLFNKTISGSIGMKQSSFVLNDSSDLFLRMQTAIGQGQTQITPLHNAMITATIANSGVMMEPYLVDYVTKADGDVIKQFKPKQIAAPISHEEASYLGEFMRSTVTDGTGSKLQGLPVEAAGKTGSADHKEGEKAHAWFVGYAPYDDPQIVVSILVESVGTGSEFAVPIAKDIFEAYFTE